MSGRFSVSFTKPPASSRPGQTDFKKLAEELGPTQAPDFHVGISANGPAARLPGTGSYLHHFPPTTHHALAARQSMLSSLAWFGVQSSTNDFSLDNA